MEARESQAVEGERLGKRVRKKRKIYMDSGDEEEDNQEEPEVRSIYILTSEEKKTKKQFGLLLGLSAT